jgi:hypothetical protein
MRLRAFTVVRLKCALHEDDSLKPVVVEGRQRFGAETAPKNRWYGPLKAGVNAAIGPRPVRRTSRVWGRLGGLHVDGRWTTRAGTGHRPNLGTAGVLVPNPTGTPAHRLSSTDARASTCPQGR